MIEVVVVVAHVAKNGVLTSPSLFDILYYICHFIYIYN